jgi:beta-glucosidase
MKMLLIFLITALILLNVVTSSKITEDSSKRAKEMLLKMSLHDKVKMMHGVKGTYVGTIDSNEELGIPAINMNDGPQGFRVTPNNQEGKQGTTTMWPSALTVATTWDKDLAYRWAEAMSSEFKTKGANMQLAPGIGIARVPTAGRNFEYLCGEEPYLGAGIVESVVKGIQDQGIIANAKHWINNEIEDHRMLVNAEVSEKVRFELYYPPFQAAIDAGVLSVMCSYNKINGVYACQNNETLGNLRNDLGFEGFVVSDWTATHSLVDSLNAGLDIEMPNQFYYNELTILSELKKKSITMESIDNSVYRILNTLYAMDLFDNPIIGDPTANVTSIEHNLLAREIASKATVLVKNSNNILPLALSDVASICVFGDEDTIGGSGSGKVVPYYSITPYQGMVNAVKDSGLSISVEYNSGNDLESAVSLASTCDVAVVVVATTSGEGSDRKTLSLGTEQDDLVVAISNANKNTIVSVNTPGASLLPWVDEPAAVLISMYPGQEAGNALADVIIGKINPSARLPVTFPNKDNEIEFTKEEYPGTGFPPNAKYNEELLIGYKWYDQYNVKPVYPFGYGLSYTTFEYNNLSIITQGIVTSGLKNLAVTKTSIQEVSFDLSNVGSVDGAEVCQLYIGFAASTNQPIKQLRSFNKVDLKSNEKKVTNFSILYRDISVWNEDSHSWEVIPGDYAILIGSSSSDIRLEGKFQV